MAYKRWVFQSVEGVHTVELEHGVFSGRRIIRVDGQIIDQRKKLIDTGSDHPFRIENHSCEIQIRSRFWTYFRYELLVDGQTISLDSEIGTDPSGDPAHCSTTIGDDW
jgi:hypothetical protein